MIRSLAEIISIILATLGARLFLPHQLSRSLAWPIHVGNDFPDSISNLLQSWDIELVIERSSDKDSTRGLLEYQDTTFGRKMRLSLSPHLQGLSVSNTFNKNWDILWHRNTLYA